MSHSFFAVRPMPCAVSLAEGTRLACEFAANHVRQRLTLPLIAQAAQLPPSTLSRHFHKTYGTSPMRWLWAFRTLLAAEMMASQPTWSLQQVGQECGFVSQAHFSRRFHALFGETPRSFRQHFCRHPAGSTAALGGHQLDALQRERLIQTALTKLSVKPLHYG